MTLAVPEALAVQTASWDIVAEIAGEYGQTPEQFTEEGLIALIGASEVVLTNRQAWKAESHLFIGPNVDELRVVDDLETIFRENEALVAPVEAVDIGVVDPFEADDERQVINLPPDLLVRAWDISSRLVISPEAFFTTGIDFRRLLAIAHDFDEGVVIETHVQGEFAQLPTIFTD
jgi:hypothetical protein